MAAECSPDGLPAWFPCISSPAHCWNLYWGLWKAQWEIYIPLAACSAFPWCTAPWTHLAQSWSSLDCGARRLQPLTDCPPLTYKACVSNKQPSKDTAELTKTVVQKKKKKKKWQWNNWLKSGVFLCVCSKKKKKKRRKHFIWHTEPKYLWCLRISRHSTAMPNTVAPAGMTRPVADCSWNSFSPLLRIRNTCFVLGFF